MSGVLDNHLSSDHINSKPSAARKITECGLLAAFLVVLDIIGHYLPGFGICAIVFYPLPILLAFLRHGFKESVLVGLSASFLASFFLSPFAALRMFALCVPIGVIMGFGILKGWTHFRTICVTSLAGMCILFALICLSFYMSGMDDFSLILQSTPSLSALDNPDTFEQSFFQFIVLVWPTIIFLSSLMVVLPSFLISYKISNRIGICLPPFPDILELRLHPAVCACFFSSAIGLYVGISLGWPLLIQIFFNIHFISMFFGLLEGFCVFVYYARRLHWNLLVIIGASILIVSVSFLLYALIIVGICDTIFDIRKRYYLNSL